MRTLLISPTLWRLLGGFAVGAVMTLGLSVGQDPAPTYEGTTLEVMS